MMRHRILMSPEDCRAPHTTQPAPAATPAATSPHHQGSVSRAQSLYTLWDPMKHYRDAISATSFPFDEALRPFCFR